MSELKKLVVRRKVIRSRVTISFNQINTYDSLSPLELSVQKSNLLSAKEDLLNLDKLIVDLKFPDGGEIDEDELYREIEACSDYQEKVEACLCVLDSHSNSSSSNPALDNARSLLKQPVAPLPTFSGEEEEDLMRFLNEFELTTACYKYPDRDLLLLLRQQLSGKAKTLIKSLEADKQNYKAAKELLTSAFASPENRKFATMKMLTELQLGYEDDPYEFISKVKMLQESVKSLDIKSDDFLQYFTWNGLNEKFKTQLIHVTSKSKPPFREIVNKFFEANERYLQYQKQYKARRPNKPKDERKERTSASFAINVRDKAKNKFKECVLCAKENVSSNHPIFKCPKYANPKMKLEQLERLNGCTKCASLEHTVSNCNFRFNKRCDCFKWHFRFLCPQWSTGSQINKEQKTTTKTTEASSGVVVLQNATCDSILPTFSFYVNGKKFRAFKDGGSQSSFTTRKFAESQNLRVIQNDVKLTVNGFNKPQTYLTRLVEVCFQLGDRTHKVPSLVVPELKVNLELPKLSQVIHSFKDKGYVLADSFLGDSNYIGNIDFILGADAAYCLPGSDVCFGNNSMYINSSAGILLSGPVDNYIADLRFLPQSNLASDNFLAIDHSSKMSPRCGEDESIVDVFQTHAFFVSSYLTPLDCEDF